MSRVSMFSAPFLLGFDAFEERIDRLAKAADGYPPYNIERSFDAEGAETFLISIAVAGFAEADLDVHRGIAARQFQRNFLLADGMVVKDAILRNGMLTVAVVRPKAEKIARRIEIRSA